MASINTRDEYLKDPNRVVETTEKAPWWSPKVQIGRDGYKPEGYVPGFWSTVGAGMTGDMVGNHSTFSNILGAITSPFQFMEAKGAPERIYERTMSEYPAELTELNAIESDPTKKGSDWFAKLPKAFKDQLASYEISPTNQEMDAYTFARDIKDALAHAVYNREAAAGTEKYGQFSVFLGSIGASVVSDPTALLPGMAAFKASAKTSMAAGKAVSLAGRIAAKAPTGVVSSLAINTALNTAQAASGLIESDSRSERLGIVYGDMTAEEIAQQSIYSGAISLAAGSVMAGGGYFAGMGLSKFNKKTSVSALELAEGLVNNPNVFKSEQTANLLNKIVGGVDLTPNEGGAIFAEVLNAQFGTHLKGSEWDWDSYVAIGVSPIDLAHKVFTEGYSGRQINDILNNAAAVIEHAKTAVPLKYPVDTMGPPVEMTGPPAPMKPLLPIRALPDFVEAAGYMWGPRGDLIKDPSKVQASAPVAPAVLDSGRVKEPWDLTADEQARADKLIGEPNADATPSEREAFQKKQDDWNATLDAIEEAEKQHKAKRESPAPPAETPTAGVLTSSFDDDIKELLKNATDRKQFTKEFMPIVKGRDPDKVGAIYDIVDNDEIFAKAKAELETAKAPEAPKAASVAAVATPVEPAKGFTREPLLPVVDDSPKSDMRPGISWVLGIIEESKTTLEFANKFLDGMKDSGLSKDDSKNFAALIGIWLNPETTKKSRPVSYERVDGKTVGVRSETNDLPSEWKDRQKTLTDIAKKMPKPEDLKKQFSDALDTVPGVKEPLIPMISGPNNRVTLEIPSIRDRLVWMSGKNHPNKAQALSLLARYYNLNPMDVRAIRAKMNAAIPDRMGRNIDRVQVVGKDGSYTSRILQVGQDTTAAPKAVKVPKVAPAPTTARADAYVAQRNAAVDRAEAKRQASAAAKAAGKPEPKDVEIEVPGLNREATAAYNQMLKTGKYKDAFDLLNTTLVGEGNFFAIKELSGMTMDAKELLQSAYRIPDEATRIEIVNEAKNHLNEVNRELEKYRQRLFAVSSKDLGGVKISSPLDASQGPMTRAVLGTPWAPSTQFYVEPVSGDTGQAMHRTKMILDPLFVGNDPSNLASRIDTDYPKGFFFTVGNALGKFQAALFQQTEAGKMLSTKIPVLSHLVNFIAPSSLSNASEIGSKKITPSLYGGRTRIAAESLAITMDATKKLADLGIHVGTPEYRDIAITAMREKQTNKIHKTRNREAVDAYKEGLKYYNIVGEEGVLVGKIKQADPNHVHIKMNELAGREIDKVAEGYRQAVAAAFSRDNADIHEPTLASIRTASILDAQGKKVTTLADLRAVDPQAADEYLLALNSTKRGSPVYDFAHKVMRVRNGLDVTDDRNLIREISRYMNSGFGRSLDEELLLSPVMTPYIETDMHVVFNDYDRNIRYNFMKQDAVNRFLSNLTGSEVTGITYADMMDYFRGIMLEHKIAPDAEINYLFDAMIKKEMQINHRSTHNLRDGEALLDAGMSLLSAPIQTLVITGSSFTSNIMEVAKALTKAVTTAAGGTGGNRTFLGSLGQSIRHMTKAQRMAGYAGMMQISTHGQVPGIDMPSINYSGGYLRTKMSNLSRPWKTFGSAWTTKADSTPKWIAHVVKSFADIPTETAKQLFHADNIAAANYRIYQGANMYDMAGVFEQFHKDPAFLTKVQPSETVNRMNEAGLFSKEGKKGLDAILKHNPGILFDYFEFDDLYRAVMDMKTNRNVSDADADAASKWYQAYWDAVHRQTDAHTMTIPGPWDVSDPDTSPVLNRFMNTFSGYSRWMYSRNYQQNFPNSSSAKIGSMLVYYAMAEATALMLKDSMSNPDLFAQMMDDDDNEDLLNDYMVRGMLRVPLFGQLTNGTVEGASLISGYFTGKNNSWARPSMFSGASYKRVAEELAKAARGEDYDSEVVRKGIPLVNAPIFGGIIKKMSED